MLSDVHKFSPNARRWGSGKSELTVALSKWEKGLHTKALLY